MNSGASFPALLTQQGAASHLVCSIEGVSPPSDQHVLVSVQHAPHRPLQPVRSRRSTRELWDHTGTLADSGPYLSAATATAVDSTALRVSFPPKPPPILLTRTTTRLLGTPKAFATRH